MDWYYIVGIVIACLVAAYFIVVKVVTKQYKG